MTTDRLIPWPGKLFLVSTMAKGTRRLKQLELIEFKAKLCGSPFCSEAFLVCPMAGLQLISSMLNARNTGKNLYLSSLFLSQAVIPSDLVHIEDIPHLD